MGILSTQKIKMFDGLVWLYQTTNTDRPDEVLFEFRIRPNSKNGYLLLPEWNPELDPEIVPVEDIVLPLYDLDKFSTDEFRRMRYNDQLEIILDGKKITGVDYQKNNFHKCVDIKYQRIRGPKPTMNYDPLSDRYSNNRNNLITFEEAEELLKHSLTKEDNYTAFGNVVVVIVRPVHRTKTGIEFSRMIKRKLETKLTPKLVAELMYYAEELFMDVVNYQVKMPRTHELYRIAYLMANIKKRYRSVTIEFKFLSMLLDFIDMYVFICNKQLEDTVKAHEMKYHYQFNSILTIFQSLYMGPQVVLFKPERILKHNRHYELPMFSELRSDDLLWCQELIQQLRYRAEAVVEELEYKAIQEKIKSSGNDFNKMVEVRTQNKLRKKDRKKLDKRIKKENKVLMKAQNEDFIGSPRVDKSVKKARLLAGLIDLIPTIIGITISVITGLLLRKQNVPATSGSC